MECFYIVTVLWIFSLCLHEFGHAWVAYQGGDYTVRDKGYLTFNPLKYTDPFFSLILPLIFVAVGGIGLPGGAVYINRELLRSRAWGTGVSLAGPAANLVLILIIGALFRFDVVHQDTQNLAAVSLAFLLFLEISALLFNLLPIPPLDGFQAVAPWLGEEFYARGMAMSNVGFFFVFIAVSYVPALRDPFWTLVLQIAAFLGVDPILIRVGWDTYTFWDRPS
jgi:Zn-dependent protease